MNWKLGTEDQDNLGLCSRKAGLGRKEGSELKVEGIGGESNEQFETSYCLGKAKRVGK